MIEVSGGFAGLNQTYEGNLDLDQKLVNSIIFENENIELNKNLRDGFVYKINLKGKDLKKEFNVDEKSLSKSLELLINKVKNN